MFRLSSVSIGNKNSPSPPPFLQSLPPLPPKLSIRRSSSCRFDNISRFPPLPSLPLSLSLSLSPSLPLPPYPSLPRPILTLCLRRSGSSTLMQTLHNGRPPRRHPKTSWSDMVDAQKLCQALRKNSCLRISFYIYPCCNLDCVKLKWPTSKLTFQTDSLMKSSCFWNCLLKEKQIKFFPALKLEKWICDLER